MGMGQMARGGDFVLLRGTMAERIKEYGIKASLDKNKGTTIGVVCSFNGANLVVTLGDEVEIYRWGEIYDDVVKIYRNRAYGSEYKAMELEESAMALYANAHDYRRIKEKSTGTPSAIFSYILTSSNIVYPTGYARLDFDMKELFSEKNGFYEADNG
jgi:hypothetical protein